MRPLSERARNGTSTDGRNVFIGSRNLVGSAEKTLDTAKTRHYYGLIIVSGRPSRGSATLLDMKRAEPFERTRRQFFIASASLCYLIIASAEVVDRYVPRLKLKS